MPVEKMLFESMVTMKSFNSNEASSSRGKECWFTPDRILIDRSRESIDLDLVQMWIGYNLTRYIFCQATLMKSDANVPVSIAWKMLILIAVQCELYWQMKIAFFSWFFYHGFHTSVLVFFGRLFITYAT